MRQINLKSKLHVRWKKRANRRRPVPIDFVFWLIISVFCLGPDSSSKIFGNSFFDLNIDKPKTINPTLENFENIEIESLDIDDFLLENGISETMLIEQLTKSENESQNQANQEQKSVETHLDKSLCSSSSESIFNIRENSEQTHKKTH